MKSPPTLGTGTLARLVRIHTRILEALAASRPDEIAASKAEAATVLERALFELARKLRPRYRYDQDLAMYLDEVRRNTLQAVADTITIQYPELKKLLYIITDPTHPRA